ncbi:bile acid germinant receptor pseudoprotease CspC [Romboutsia sp. 1001713B170207_170306_H8]|uniref:bile acid germinant receptor pseudoprotease CspC n=1 Tax=Romboutsia sp. 1001713B170207_170306_H8 TaxID=2787112 RepID=UPI00082074DF|nr:bile acid germinant receptor pseudoprotease CspC [Romboutsia sp. 1001713B170207_170306_H8]SCH41459.1 C5a peptidase precursor [uncultured Clostridium sp.]
MGKSYSIVYVGDISNALSRNGLNDFMVLNNQLTVLYTDDDFNSLRLNRIEEIAWWQEGRPISSLIQIGEGISDGETVSSASQVEYIENNPYITVKGEGVMIAIIDSGIDYLHPDFINDDNTSKIISIWDQNGNEDEKSPPQGMIFGSEFTREDLNRAILENDPSLTVDNIGTGTIAAGIASGSGRKNPLYKGVAPKSELVVVKLREYEGTFLEGRINYINNDFLAAIKYIIDVAEKENKLTIINLTVGERSRSVILTNLLDTFEFLTRTGIVVVSGAGNEGNTNIHYEGILKNLSSTDVILEVGNQKALDITMCPNGPGRSGVQLISPSGELSYRVDYSPDNEVYRGKFNLENTTYEIQAIYPWLLSGNGEVYIKINNIKPGIWTIRTFPEFVTTGEFDLYLPNGNLISSNTKFLDPNSFTTITLYGATDSVITVGAFNDKTNSMWIGSSKGPIRARTTIKPDIVAPGVDIISTFINQEYIKSTGTGVSSSLTCGVLALIMEYISLEGGYQRNSLFTQVLKTYLMLGATKSPIYTYPNDSQGYGILNLRSTIEAIANNL